MSLNNNSQLTYTKPKEDEELSNELKLDLIESVLAPLTKQTHSTGLYSFNWPDDLLVSVLPYING